MLFDASVDGIIVIDDSLAIVWANPGAQRLLGWSPSQLVEMNVLELLHAEDLAESAVLLERLHSGIEDDPPMIVRVRTMGNADVVVEVKGSNLTTVPGIGGIVLTARDITPRIRLEAALIESQRRFESLVKHSNDAIVVLDPAMRVTYVSPSIEYLTGYTIGEVIGADASEVVLDPQRADLIEAFNRVITSGDTVESVRLRILQSNGEPGWYGVRVSNRMDDPAIGGVIANLRDMNDVVAAEDEAVRLTEIFELTHDLVTVVDGESKLLYMNPACARFFGFSEMAVPLGELWHGPGFERAEGAPCLFADGQRSWTAEAMLPRSDGERIPFSVQVIAHPDNEGNAVRYSAVAHDISEIKRLTASLEVQALHDPLTGLPNRTLLETRMRELASRRPASDSSVALLFIDLDHFKVINDSLGHDFGDRLLQVVAARLVSFVRPGDTVARFGGDEFVVLCEGISGVEMADEVARRVTEVMREPLQVDGIPIHLGVSVGIAVAEAGTAVCDPIELIRDADTAMYRAKSQGRGQSVLFDDELRRRAVERQQIEVALREAPCDGSLELHYQPIVELSTGRLTSVESLVRWRRDGQLLGPMDFVPVAEETGLIVPLGNWVLDHACSDLAEWRRMPERADLKVSVNVSARQLQIDGFVDVVSEALDRWQLPGDSLVLEITESVLLEDLARVRGPLESLRSMGVQIAIDDFGTGYSSLTYLAELPVSVVKLDRTFLLSAGADQVRNRLVAGAVQLVTTMGLSCVAEGIESAEQFEWLRSLGCTRGQGYHIARPMPGEVMGQMMRSMGSGPWMNDQSCAVEVL